VTSVTVVGAGATLTLDTLDSDEVVRINRADNPNMKNAGAPVSVATNRVANPSFETGYSSWSPTNCTASVITSFPQMTKAGSNILQAVSDGTAVIPSVAMTSATYRPAVTAGQYVGFTAFMATETNYQVAVQIQFRDGAGASLGYYASPWVTGSFYAGANPQIVQQAPANTASVAYFLLWRVGDGSTMASGKRMWADAAKCIVAASQEEAQYWLDFPYWDGANAPTDFTTAWSSTAHLSDSVLYANTPSKVTQVPGTGAVSYLNNATVNPRHGSHIARLTWTKGGIGGSAGIVYTEFDAGNAGDVRSVLVSLRTSSSAKDVTLLFRFRMAGVAVGQAPLAYVRLTPNEWQDFRFDGLVATGAYDSIQVYGLISNSNTQVPGETLDMDSVLLEAEATSNPTFYDGNTPDTSDVEYSWLGTPDFSESRALFHVTQAGYPLPGEQPTDLPPRIRVTVSGVTGTKDYQLVRTVGGETNIVPGWVERSITGSDVDTDWAAPLNRVIRYQLIEVTSGVVATAEIVLDSRAAILQDPIQPDRYIRVSARGARIPGWATMTEGSTAQVVYGNSGNLVPIMGSLYPVALGGQVTRGNNVPELFSTYTESDADQFRNMVLGGSTVFLLRPTQDMKPLPPLAYLSGAFTEAPITSQWDPANGTTHWEINANLVAAVIQAAKSGYITYDQVQALLGGLTYDQVQAKYASLKYLDVQADPLIYQTL
jgi:hypothetical protein